MLPQVKEQATVSVGNNTQAQVDLIQHCNDVINRLDSESIYSKYSHFFAPPDANGKLRGMPPFRDSSSKNSFTVFPDKGFHDPGNDQHGRFSGFPLDYIHSMRVGRWEKAEGRDWIEALKDLSAIANIPFPEIELSQAQISKAQKWEQRRSILSHAFVYCQSMLHSAVGEKARLYLNNERGLDEAAMKELGLGFYDSREGITNYLTLQGFTKDEIKNAALTPVNKPWNGFITYPWYDAQSRPLTMYGRYQEKKHPNPDMAKTLALAGVGTKQSPLYFDRVLKARHKEIIFVEGVNDAALLQSMGETRVCAGVAASFSKDQIETLKRNRITKVYALGDPDGGGVGGTNSNLDRLSIAGIDVYVPPMLSDKLDPDEFTIKHGLEAFKAHIAKSEHGFRWKAKQIISAHGTDTDLAKDAIIADCLKWSKEISQFENANLKLELHFWSEVSKQLGMDIQALKNSLEAQYRELGDIDQPKRESRKMGMIELLDFLPQTYQGSLRFNELTQAVEVEGKEILVEDAYVILAKDHNVKASKSIASDAFIAVAKENTFHPVRDYLNAIESKPKADIDNLASRYLGTNNALYDTFLKKTLIAAVARIYNPGCKVDTSLVLQGKQGVGKSTFFNVLGGSWFDDSMGSGSDKDDLLILNKCWVQEWGELERVFSKKQAGELKSFLSRSEDTYRAPYARSTASRKRMNIIVGSVNNAQFLVDPTGDRRYWVVPVGTSKIDSKALEAERDSIWASAIAAYKANQQWWLSDEEQLLSNQNNNQFRDRDEWEMEIENYVSDKAQVAIKEILVNCFEFENNGKMDRSSQYRVKNALVSLGWTNSANAVSHTWQPKSGYPNTERMRVWRPDTSNTSSQGCAEECVSQTLYLEGVCTSNTSNTSNSKEFKYIDNDNTETMGNISHEQTNKSLKKNVQGCADVQPSPETLPEGESSSTHQPTHQTHQKGDVSVEYVVSVLKASDKPIFDYEIAKVDGYDIHLVRAALDIAHSKGNISHNEDGKYSS